ncbi:MAG: thermonuclease family protein [Nitrososphaerales archaeon]
MPKWYVLLTLLIVFANQSYTQGISESISVANLTMMDQDGTIQALLTNNTDAKQNFVYIVQVKDSNGYTAQLAWVEAMLQSRESLPIMYHLTIEAQDSYTVEIFVWRSIGDPIPLSYAHTSYTFNSLNHTYPCKGVGACFEGRVTRIVDGDTLDVDGKRISLALVDAPDRGEPGYTEAAKFTSAICPGGSAVLVDQDGKQMNDSYDTMIAVVYCDGALLNAELLFADHGIIMKNLCSLSEFGDEEWAMLFGC